MTVYTKPLRRPGQALLVQVARPGRVDRQRRRHRAAMPARQRPRQLAALHEDRYDRQAVRVRASSTGPDRVAVLVTLARAMLPASVLGTGQPSARRAVSRAAVGREGGACWAGGRRCPRPALARQARAPMSLIADLQVDEGTLVDPAAALVEHLPPQRQAGSRSSQYRAASVPSCRRTATIRAGRLLDDPEPAYSIT